MVGGEDLQSNQAVLYQLILKVPLPQWVLLNEAVKGVKRARYDDALPRKCVHCSMASVVYTSSCVIFSYIFYGTKVIAHSQTAVALPASFHYVSLCIIVRTSVFMTKKQWSCIICSHPPLLLTPLGHLTALLLCSCSEAGRHPSLIGSPFESTCSFVPLILAYCLCTSCNCKGDHRKC